MPRNTNGVCTVEEAPFQSGTSISSTQTNSNNADFASMLTDSLSRSGDGGMTDQLSLDATGFNYAVDPNTGMSRSAADTQVITCGGANWTFTATDFTAPGGVSLLPLIGEIKMWALPTAPTGWLLLIGQACTTSFPLWRAALIAASNPYGTSGGDPLFPDMRCVVPAGKDTSRGLLTGSTVLGALLGEQSRTLGTSNLPAYTPSGDIPAASITGGITGQFEVSLQGFGASSPKNVMVQNAAGGSSLPIAGTVDPVFNGTAQGGTSTAFGIVQPTIVINFIGRAA